MHGKADWALPLQQQMGFPSPSKKGINAKTGEIDPFYVVVVVASCSWWPAVELPHHSLPFVSCSSLGTHAHRHMHTASCSLLFSSSTTFALQSTLHACTPNKTCIPRLLHLPQGLGCQQELEEAPELHHRRERQHLLLLLLETEHLEAHGQLLA